MPRCASATSVLLVAMCLVGCTGETPDRAQITRVTPMDSGAGSVLEVEQQIRWSPKMLDALANGIPLRLVYLLECGSWQSTYVVELHYAPLQRSYTLVPPASPARRFGRRTALLAALDRVRLPLAEGLPAGCDGRLRLALDLTSLPTPLRFPALLYPEDWRLVSPSVAWPSATE